MSQANYRVVLTGAQLDNFDLQDVVTTAAQLFKCSEEKAQQFFAGKPTPLKKEMDEGTAHRYRDRLMKAGIDCRIEAIATVTHVAEKLAGNLELEPIHGEAPVETQVAQNSTQSAGVFQCPKCRTPQEKGVECVKCGIIFAKYQPPAANVQTPAVSEEEAADADEWDEICLFVGEIIEPYRHKFRSLYDNNGKYKLQWHWPAFFIPVPWMIFRKLYVWAAVYTIIMAVSPLYLLIPVILLPGFVGNYLYYRQAVQKINKITSNGDQRRQDIAQAGGSNSILMTIGISLLAGLVMSIIMYKLIFASYVEQAMENVQQDVEFLEGDGSSDMQNPGVQTTKFQMLMLKNAVLMQKRLLESQGNSAGMPANMQELMESMHHEAGAMNDAWGTPMQFEYESGNMTFISAGPDKSFDTDDDVVLETEVQ